MKLNKVDAESLLYSNNGDTVAGVTKVDDFSLYHGRWDDNRRLVVEIEHGQYYATDYFVGLTEYQEYSSWDGAEEIEFFPVERIPVQTYEYVKL